MIYMQAGKDIISVLMYKGKYAKRFQSALFIHAKMHTDTSIHTVIHI